jgi:hypothetical protein
VLLLDIKLYSEARSPVPFLTLCYPLVLATQVTTISINYKLFAFQKPAGAVPVLGNVDVFKAAIRRPPSCSSCSSEDSEFTGDTSSGIGRTRSEPRDSTKRLVFSSVVCLQAEERIPGRIFGPNRWTKNYVVKNFQLLG